MKKAFAVLFIMAISFAGAAQTTDSQPAPRQGLFAGQQKYGLVEGKAGRAFLRSGETLDDDVNVFYGGVGLNVGVVLKNNRIGVGGVFECVDVTDKSYSFPVFVELRHYFGSDSPQGFFVGAKGGWIFGGKRSFSTVKPIEDGEDLIGTTTRSLQGPYGEVMAGYRFREFDFFVAYNYRVVKYDTSYPHDPNLSVNYDESWKKNLHVVMGGVSFRLF